MLHNRFRTGASSSPGRFSRSLISVLCMALSLTVLSGSSAPAADRNHPYRDALIYQGAEGEWTGTFGKPGVNGPVYGLARHDDMLIVGGAFERAGHHEAHYIAGWDGAGWIPLGDPDWGPDQDVDVVSVHAFAIYGSLLVAGGQITGGNVHDVIAAWDGISWTEFGDLGDPVFSTVRTMTVYQGDLIAGGFIPPKRYITSYKDGVWNAVGDGMNGEVLAVAVYGDNLIAAGKFTKADDKAANHIAKWDGSSWEQVGAGLNGNIHALSVFGDHLVAAGDFAGFIAVWNDTSWTTVPAGIPGGVRSLGVCRIDDTDSLLYGGGGDGSSGFVIRNRSGSLLDWDVVTAGLNSTVHAIGGCPGDSVVYLGGTFTWIDTVEAFHVAMLDGHLPSGLGQAGYGLDSEVEVLGVYGDDLVAATWPPSVLRWLGDAWEVLAGQADDHINTMLSHGGYLYLGGAFTQIEGQVLLHVARWNGTSWSQLGAGVSGDVYDLEVYNGKLIAGGSFSQAGGVAAGNLAMWDGSSWTEVGGGRGHPVDQVTVWDDKIVVSVRNSIQSWDGRLWRLLGTTYGTIRCLEAYGPSLLVAGDFYEIGGVSATRAALWDGDSWSGLGMGLEGGPDYWGGVLDIAIYNGNPVAAGFFDSPCCNIARWDGFAWQSLGGLDSWANALTVWDDHLVAGGTFQLAGDLSSYRVAVWDDFVDPLDSLTAVGRDEAISVSWRNPADQAYRGTHVRYSVDTSPQGPAEGLPLPNGNDGRFEGMPGSDSSFLHTGLPSDVTYYYSAFTYDDLGRFSSGAFVSATTLDKNPPDTVSHFTVTPGVDFLQIRWTNPLTQDYRGTLLRYSKVEYPVHPDSGNPVPNGNEGRFEGQPGSQGSFTHSGVEVARTHYYSAFAYDQELNHAAPVHACGLVEDTLPPELELAVFQNPYLTQYLDIYLLCSEPADPASVHIKVQSDSLSMVSVGDRQDLWLSHYELTGVGGTVMVIGCATDTTGNPLCQSKEFAAGLITRRGGGRVESANGWLRLMVPPGSVADDAYITVMSCDMAGVDPVAELVTVGMPPDRASCRSCPGAGPAYRLAPSGILGNSKAHLEIGYGGIADGAGLQPDRYYIEQVGGGRLETYVDPEAGVVTAEVSCLGTFRLATGEPGSSEMADPKFLRLAPSRPNPLRGETTITFGIKASQHVVAAVYDVEGRLVETIMDRLARPGTHRVTWRARTAGDREIPSGIYFLKVTTEHKHRTQKLALVR